MDEFNIIFVRRDIGPNLDPRRVIEWQDSQMIKTPPGSFANMPRQAIHHEFPKSRLHRGDIIGEKFCY